MSQSTRWRWGGLDQKELMHSLQTAIAAVASLLVARLFRLPESYWAAITTMIVMQSTLGAALTISRQRLAGTALGAAMGALLATTVGSNLASFAAGVFFLGIICALLRLERNAYRYAGITLAIVLLIEPSKSAWIVALDRFIEISIGIAVGLILTAIWPEQTQSPAAQSY